VVRRSVTQLRQCHEVRRSRDYRFWVMPQSLAEVLYELGRAALEQQERQVAELRARTQALLAGAALIASFFGAAAIERAGLNGPSIAALVVLSLSVSAGVYVLAPHRMKFVLDVHDVHRELYEPESEKIGMIQTRLAYTFQDFRSANRPAVDRLFWAFGAGAGLLVVQIGLRTWALAIAS
jgi:hypothetical protein